MKRSLSGICAWLAAAVVCLAQPPASVVTPVSERADGINRAAAAVLGPQDEVSIFVLEMEELAGKMFTVDQQGDVSLPLVGRVGAAGRTAAGLEEEIRRRLETYLRDPQVSVNLVTQHSRPASVIGAVNTPGVYQLKGRRSLVELLTMAGGLRADAGDTAKVIRKLSRGRIPLPNAADDTSGEFSVAEIDLKAMLSSESAAENIDILPEDCITVSAAGVIYVVGDVVRPGPVPAGDRDTMTILQAITLVGGPTPSAAANKSRIMRPVLGGPKRAELAVDVDKILAGKAPDVPLLPGDILVVPDNAGKRWTARLLEIGLTSGVSALMYGLIYH